MIKRFGKGVVIGVLFMWLLVPASFAGEKEGEHIAIAVLPCTDPVMTFRMFHPLITYLTQETGFDIKIVVPKSFSEFKRNMKNREIDFAYQDPHTYVELEDLYNRDALVRALSRDGTASQSAVVVVRKGSGINKLEDLRGKVVMFGPRLSAHKWLAARWLFEANGIDIEQDLKAYSNGGCCEDIAFSVYIKQVDAGIICDDFFSGHLSRQPELGVEVEELVAIGRTQLVPTRVFAARYEIGEEVVNKVNQALLKLDNANPEHSEILTCAEISGFEKSTDEFYDAIRMLVGDSNTH